MKILVRAVNLSPDGKVRMADQNGPRGSRELHRRRPSGRVSGASDGYPDADQSFV
jgi:hypothetical protein